ncbi:hypothetical protein [Henriciella sp.]|uniref:hypothetical protein n=1 Tax=Henriciella sp. TaxID=1968823 RepID=UPI002637A362|nr:hypothetical protein [Henriciella sp.]
MMILLVLAGVLLVLSAALFFGPQLVAYGPHGLREAFSRPEAHLVTLALAGILAWLLFGTSMVSALISGGETVQVMAGHLMGPRFS